MIVFDSSYTSIGLDTQGGIGEVPINGFLRSIERVREGVIISDTTGNWGLIMYQNTSFESNFDLYNYLYPFTQIGRPQTKKIEICSADLLTSFSSPVILVSASGIGLINMPVGFGYKSKYKSVVYDFAENLYVHCASKTDADCFYEINKGIINAAGDRSSILNSFVPAGVSNDDAFVDNDDIILMAKTSDATTGDGYLTVYITYVVVEESWYDGVYCT